LNVINQLSIWLSFQLSIIFLIGIPITLSFWSIKKGNKVKIICGKDKNKEGEIIEIDRKKNRAKVKGLNMIKKHVKTTKEKKGGIFPKESFIHISNLKLIDEKVAKKKEAKK